MLLQLSDSDLAKMPPSLSTALVNWLQCERLKPAQPTGNSQRKTDAEQLALTLVSASSIKQNLQVASKPVTSIQSSNSDRTRKTRSHIRLTQLFAVGIIKPGMPVRVRLKQELAKKCGHEYGIKDLSISPKGTVLYQGEEFDKPSPLAARVNGSATNGWEYIEVLKNGQWVCLDELRKIWRNIL
ncbi:MAG: hypothetical protein HC769_25835 [Cyanobacteria bacterium CRU_2_1]|nr:hypothetical protein [Cyanobacteria bacterium CRU_2_1]